jgi:hypothetical protein
MRGVSLLTPVAPFLTSSGSLHFIPARYDAGTYSEFRGLLWKQVCLFDSVRLVFTAGLLSAQDSTELCTVAKHHRLFALDGLDPFPSSRVLHPSEDFRRKSDPTRGLPRIRELLGPYCGSVR